MGTRTADPIGDGGSETTLRLVAGGYVGVVFAGVVTTGVALTGLPAAIDAALQPAAVLVGCYLLSLLFATGIGLATAGRGHRLPRRFGRTLWRRLLPYGPALALAAIGIASVGLSTQERAATVAVGTAGTILVAGYALATIARTRYVAQVTATEPAAVWEWEPPGSTWLTTLLFGLWLYFALGNAIAGNWTTAFVWMTLGVLWTATRLVEGHWRIGSAPAPKLQVYDTGLVKQRPYAATIVPWETIDRVWLREGELVLDRGLFDVRFDSDELEDPEAIRAAIERRIGSTGRSSDGA